MRTHQKRLIIIGLILVFIIGSPIENSLSMQPRKERYIPFKESPSKSIDSLPIPEHAKMALVYFCNVGIAAYFDMNKKVPKWWEEDYIKSGIPMMMPNDYVTGKPYHFVKKLDMNDTSGFTYDYKNPQQCEFEFVFKNSKTNENFSQVIFIGQKPRQGGKLYNFNESKRDYCINFLTTYAKIYASKHDGKAPQNLKQMLKGEGKLIEAGWKWSAKPGANAYFEWGMDIKKCRVYFTAQRIQKKETHVQQLAFKGGAPVEGKEHWTFKSDEKIPPDVCVKTKFISADGLHAFYKSFGGR